MMTAEMKHFEAALHEKRRELMRTIRAKASGLTVGTDEAELIDQIQGMTGRDETAIMLNRFSSMLQNVERSLRAISDGSYGICAMCDEPIAPKRLQAIPWALRCVACQEQFEAAENNMVNHFRHPQLQDTR